MSEVNPIDSHVDDSNNKSSSVLKGLIVAVAVAAFFGGYFVANITDSDPGITDEQMDLILSEIDSKMVVPVDTQNPQPPLISIDDDPMKGNPDAEITIIEFSDFQCPFCARFYEQTLPSIEEEYVDTGLVNFVYRDFPLQIHANAVPAHIAAECADEQGMFWPYHDILFDKQREWDSIQPELMFAQLVQYADNLELNMANFESCLESASHVQEIQMDYQDGVRHGVTGTPAFFVGNDQDGYVLLNGAQPFSSFRDVIESKLG